MANQQPNPIPKAARKKQRLWNKVDGKCTFCGVDMWILGIHPQGRGGRMATKEHIIPKSKGGSDDQSNLTCSCKSCNQSRGSMEFELFKKLRQYPNFHRLTGRVRKTPYPVWFNILEHKIHLKKCEWRKNPKLALVLVQISHIPAIC